MRGPEKVSALVFVVAVAGLVVVVLCRRKGTSGSSGPLGGALIVNERAAAPRPWGSSRRSRDEFARIALGLDQVSGAGKLPLALAAKAPGVDRLPTYCKYKESYLVPLRDQGACASCYAFTVADVVADRLCLYTRGAVRVVLSVQELLSCWEGGDCAEGAAPEAAYRYVEAHGLPEDATYPYEQNETTRLAACRRPATGRRWFAEAGTAVNICEDLGNLTPGTARYEAAVARNVANMKRALVRYGPIAGTVYVHQDLYDYDGKRVYVQDPGSDLVGGHAIVIFGYCEAGVNTEEENFRGQAYWCCHSSWAAWPGDYPTEFGMFYVRMGTNEVGIESRASAVMPAFPPDVAAKVDYDLRPTRYDSYTEYVDDPDRHQFFALLAGDRRTRAQ